jgi:DNA-binding winged helix-turn-helix (wHTH) protein/tetratricopeptide (TPR) repeat protein
MADQTPLRLRFGAFELDEANARLTRDGRPITLPPRPFAVLCTLARRPGQLITKNALLDAVWGHQHVSESLLKNIISSLRAALSDDAKSPRFIETASRFGYRFIADIAADTKPASAVTSSVQTPAGIAAAHPAAAAEPPGPAALLPASMRAAAPPPSFVGREMALAKMRELWQQAKSGQRQLLWIAGEAGVGKTTLIESFVRELGPRVAAFGHCVEHFGSGEPYLPVLEVVREICRLDPDLLRLMRTVAPTWLVQMPWLVSEEDRALLHRELAGTHPDRMLREMRELMDHFTAGRPIVFILEDMHWSDLGTLRMMEHFARRPRPVPVLWIASFRLTQIIAENHPLHELRQDLRLHRLYEEIVLDSFSESEVGNYLAQRLPQIRFTDSFVRRVHAHTDGLPLFVAQLTDTLIAQAEKNPAAMEQLVRETPGNPLPVPDSVAGVIEKEATRLPPEVQGLLEAASVCGAEFRAGIVADMLEREPEWVRERCDELVRRRIWVRQVGIVELPDGGFDSRYAFVHALYQHVLYQRLVMSQRVALHRRAARSLGSNRAVGEMPQPAELASHHERGHQFAHALRSYAEAASRALAHFAPKDAASLSEHGLSLLQRCPDGEERLELELVLAGHNGMAASQLHGVASNEARAAFARVQAACDRLPQTPRRALTLNGLGWIYYVRGEFDEALALAGRLADLADRHSDAALFVLACNLRGVALISIGKLVQGCEELMRGVARCTDLGDVSGHAEFLIDPEVSMRLNAAFPFVNLGLADRARLQVAVGSERARRLGHPMAVMLSHWTGAMVEARLGNDKELARQAGELGKFIQTTMLPQGQGPSLWLRGLAEARLGEPRVGHRHILEGYACHARLGMYGGCTEILGYATEALILDRDWAGARRQLEEGFALAQRIGERVALPDLLLLRARIDLGENDPTAARESMHEALQEARRQHARGSELSTLVALAELKDSQPGDLAALAQAYRAMSEGFDTKVYRRAGELVGTHS